MSGAAPETWSQLARWYDALLQDGSGPHETALATLMKLAPDPPEGRLLDVGCGQGLAARALCAAGDCTVVGIDSAQEMIRIAHERTERSLSITWRVDDAERLTSCETAWFNGAVCQLALMDIGDLPAAFGSIRRVLKHGGWFAFVIGHPCFLSPDATATTTTDGKPACLMTRYFSEEFWRSSNPNGIRGRAGNHHRPLSAYLNSLLEAGFRLDRVLEPAATPLLAAQQPLYEHLPIFFAARATAV